MRTKDLTILAVLITILIIGLSILYIFQKLAKLNVIEETDLSLDIKIDQNDTSSYENFIRHNEQHQKPISEERLTNKIRHAGAYLVEYPPGKTTANLRKKIIKELNMGFLLRGLNQRKLIVITTAVHQYEEYTEKELLFKDPQVGTFSVLFLVPNKEKESYPAIISLHGHGDSNEHSRDSFGKDLAKEGFVVIMPSFRAVGCDTIETTISKRLLLNGFHLMEFRIYETFLLIKYLKYKDFVNENKIGIMGHSCGSDVAYLVSIINKDLRAIVFDMYPKLNSLCQGEVHCESVPGLAYYNPQINDPSTLKIPSQKFDYDYPGQNDKQEMINFFKEKLVER